LSSSAVAIVVRRSRHPSPGKFFEAALKRVRLSFELCLYGYVVTPEHDSPAAPRTAAANSRGRDKVIEGGSIAAIDRRGGAFLAKALL
jgi:hypothetical protein